MTDISKELGVQSYCFRGFDDNAKVTDLVKQIGVNKVELSGAHMDFADASAYDKVISTYRDAGVDIVSIGVNTLGTDEAEQTHSFELAKAAGAKHIGVNFPVDGVPECYRIAEQLADKYDMLLGIHNHGGRHWLGSADMLKNVFTNTSERIGLCLDTAWALDSGEDPVEMSERFADRLYALHLKDFVFSPARKPEDVVVGAGNLDLPKLMGVLKSADFSGIAILEYEGDVDNPVPVLTECVKAIRQQA